MSEQIPQKVVHIETYGCQMNVADTEVVAAILQTVGYSFTEKPEEADVMLINTCSVRDNAEKRVIGRIENLQALRRKCGKPAVIGVLGCMAERVKERLLAEHGVDLVAGPDAYTDLPNLLADVEAGGKAINVTLSKEETYRDVVPLKLPGLNISGFVSIMRGCDEFCSYCIVPFTRGRERSREPGSIYREIAAMKEAGFREVTLLGQKVNGYFYRSEEGDEVDFPDLLRAIHQIAPQMRIRYTSPHPRHMSDKLIETMAEIPQICAHIHLPVQSGSNAVLERMRRGYTREWYLDRIATLRSKIPHCGISTDIFCGFSGETEEDHLQTLSLMETVRFDSAFLFKYSERPTTYAARHYPDDVPEEVKLRRLEELISLQNRLSLESNERDKGKIFEVLVEGVSRKSRLQYYGRTTTNKVVVFPKGEARIGSFVTVRVLSATQATLIGELCAEKGL